MANTIIDSCNDQLQNENLSSQKYLKSFRGKHEKASKDFETLSKDFNAYKKQFVRDPIDEEFEAKGYEPKKLLEFKEIVRDHATTDVVHGEHFTSKKAVSAVKEMDGRVKQLLINEMKKPGHIWKPGQLKIKKALARSLESTEAMLGDAITR